MKVWDSMQEEGSGVRSWEEEGEQVCCGIESTLTYKSSSETHGHFVGTIYSSWFRFWPWCFFLFRSDPWFWLTAPGSPRMTQVFSLAMFPVHFCGCLDFPFISKKSIWFDLKWFSSLVVLPMSELLVFGFVMVIISRLQWSCLSMVENLNRKRKSQECFFPHAAQIVKQKGES